MVCTISQSLYKSLLEYYKNAMIETVHFAPFHKGLDVFFSGKTEGISDIKAIAEELESWWYDNDFQEGGTLTLHVNESGSLYFDFTKVIDWVFWDSELHVPDFLNKEMIKEKLILTDEPFSVENIYLNIILDYSCELKTLSVNDYRLNYYQEDGTEIELSSNAEIKNMIIENLIKSLDRHSIFSGEKGHSFSLIVDETRVYKFVEYADGGTIELQLKD